MVKTSHVEVHSVRKEGLHKMSDLRQMTAGSEMRENLSSHRKEDRQAVLACNLPIMSRVILVPAVNLSLLTLKCNQYNEFYIN